MTTTSHEDSLLRQLRALVPLRPLLKHEALRIAELQANHLLDALGVIEPGTPTEAILALSFIEVHYRSDLPVSGSAQWIKPRWRVLINADEPEVRQRFSLMHGVADLRSSGATEVEAEHRAELIADAFAAALMPRRFVKRLWGQGVQHPRDLATYFGVSDVAMRYRLHQLGLTEPYARHEGHRSTGPRQIYWRERTAHLVPLGVPA